MENLITIRVGGVPEHFNSPWHIAIETGAFAKAGLDVQWTTIDTGTGAMCKALAAGEIDVAVALTEGVVADIAKGAEHKILGVYIQSPLTWGVHVAADSKFQTVESLKGATFGISRLGSGSHLMAFVQALALGWNVEEDVKFNIVGNLDGARAAFKAGEADTYMWEKVTTKPHVDSGEWRRVGCFETPWPCFVATANNAFVAQQGAACTTMLKVLADTAAAFKAGGKESVDYASNKYGIQVSDTQDWFGTCEWHAQASIADGTLVQVLESLAAVGVLSTAQAKAATPMSLVSAITTLDCEMPDVMYNWRVAGLYNALEARGKKTGPLEVDDLVALGHLDQYHYLGTEACDHAASTLGLCSGRRVLDIGSGIGGPARYMAYKTGCSVHGVELQVDLVKAAIELTGRVEALDDKVSFEAGDCTKLDFAGQYDHFISLLVFLHIPGRDLLFANCHKALVPGGTFLIEDFYCKAPFTDVEKGQLRQNVMATSVVTLDQYRMDLEAAGFTDIVFEDLTSIWQPWTKARHEGFVGAKETTIAMHGEEVFASRAHFYGVIDSLFAGGNLGGVKITGRRRGELEASLASGRKTKHTSCDIAKVLETGVTQSEVVGTIPKVETTFGVIQPSFPAGDFHDSLQYHFFCGPYCVAARVFHTATLQHHSAWCTDERDGRTFEICNSSTPMTTSGDGGLSLDGSFKVVDGDGSGCISHEDQFKIDFAWTADKVFSWEVPGQDSAVIHRPHMSATMVINGETFVGDGYSKRYYGPGYGPGWGYRFIVGFVAPGTGYTCAGEESIAVWTADATFDVNKYNYFKLLHPDGLFQQAESKDTWQQENNGYAFIDSNRYEVEVETVGDWWETVIEGEHMKSKMRQRFCKLKLMFNGQTYVGRALNEQCYGSLA